MLLDRSDALLNLSDPAIILGPRKRCPTEHVLENGDLLVCKKARKMDASTVEKPESLTHLIRTTPPPSQSIDSTEGDQDQSSDGTQAIVIDDSDEEGSDEGSDGGEVTDEDDDAELGM
jgi:hypothetical protein